MVVVSALRARQHGVVIDHRRNARVVLTEEIAIRAPEAHHEPVRRRAVNQLLHWRAPPPRRNRQRAPFQKRTRIAQRIDVLARRALLRLAPPRCCIGARAVARLFLARENFSEIGADVIEIDRVRIFAVARTDIRRLHEHERMTFKHRVARLRRDRAHIAGDAGGDDVLHLHRFHDEEVLPLPHRVADLHRNRADRALQRRTHRRRALGPIDVRIEHARFFNHRCGRAALAVRQHRQRIARIDLRAGALLRCAALRASIEIQLLRRRRAGQRARVFFNEPRVKVARTHAHVREDRLQ